MAFLEQPFSIPIIYNPEKRGEIFGGEMCFPPIITILGPIIYNQTLIIYNQTMIIYNGTPDYI